MHFCRSGDESAHYFLEILGELDCGVTRNASYHIADDVCNSVRSSGPVEDPQIPVDENLYSFSNLLESPDKVNPGKETHADDDKVNPGKETHADDDLDSLWFDAQDSLWFDPQKNLLCDGPLHDPSPAAQVAQDSAKHAIDSISDNVVSDSNSLLLSVLFADAGQYEMLKSSVDDVLQSISVRLKKCPHGLLFSDKVFIFRTNIAQTVKLYSPFGSKLDPDRVLYYWTHRPKEHSTSICYVAQPEMAAIPHKTQKYRALDEIKKELQEGQRLALFEDKMTNDPRQSRNKYKTSIVQDIDKATAIQLLAFCVCHGKDNMLSFYSNWILNKEKNNDVHKNRLHTWLCMLGKSSAYLCILISC